jgi:hypothetical protein
MTNRARSRFRDSDDDDVAYDLARTLKRWIPTSSHEF